MKDFIVLMAILPLLLLFMLQFGTDYRNNERIEAIQNIVYTAKETAKQEGCFSDELKTEITEKISKKLKIPEESITITTSEGKRTRYGTEKDIEYCVSVKLDNVMAGGSMMGISNEENTMVYVIDSYTASEYLGDSY